MDLFLQDGNRFKVADAHSKLFGTENAYASLSAVVEKMDFEVTTGTQDIEIVDNAYWYLVGQINAFRTKQE